MTPAREVLDCMGLATALIALMMVLPLNMTADALAYWEVKS